MDIKNIRTSLDAVRRSQDREQNEKIAAWISSTDFPAQQSDIIARKQDGTGQWFLDSSEFSNWLHGPRSTLFCPGIPGAGKTMLAAITIDHLLQVTASKNIGLAYIYCNYKYQSGVDASALLAALLKQLVQSQFFIDESVSNLYQQHTSRGTRPSFLEISAALQTVLRSFSATYIVVDAMDECPNKNGARDQAWSSLREIQHGTDLRLLATSRSIPAVVEQFMSLPILKIRASDTDVNQYVKGQIPRLPKCIRCDRELQTMVERRIAEAVDGM